MRQYFSKFTPSVVISSLGAVALAAMLYLVVVSFTLSNDVARVAQANLDASVRAEQVAQENTRRFCAIRQNTDRQIAAQEEFVREHPEGFAGISPSDIRAAVKRMEAFRDAIGELKNCPNGTLESP